MKTKQLFMAVAMLLACLGANAQSYRYGSYGQRGGYSHYTSRSLRHNDNYCGFRVGPAFSTITSDDEYQKAGSARTGINIGFVSGLAMSSYAPIYFETGLTYTQKGGRTKYSDKEAINLDYLELPLEFKYIYSPDGHFSVQPFVGGYLGVGVAGKVKDFERRKSYPAFDDLQRFDGGLRVGCGVSYDMVYVEMAYEYGIADISKDDFGSTHNSSLMLNVGINF